MIVGAAVESIAGGFDCSIDRFVRMYDTLWLTS